MFICVAASLAASYVLFFQPKNHCAGNIEQLQLRMTQSDETMRNVKALARVRERISLKEIMPWLRGDVPVCPDGGEYFAVVTTSDEPGKRGKQTRFRINCTEHKFNQW